MEVSLPQPAVERDWSALPAGVLQMIMHRASTWQAPGSCLAAPVCRWWRFAAAGCSNICLLYFAGKAEAGDAVIAWLSQHSPQLGSLTLSMHPLNTGAPKVLQALVEAAEAAQAAGAPLPLHTLRVLDGSVHTELAGRLLACLPSLRCLGLKLRPVAYLQQEMQAALRLLQQATQLQELSLNGPSSSDKEVHSAVAGLMPCTLKHLRWTKGRGTLPDLSHLTQLTFLRLCCWSGVTSAHLPSSLQQLELRRVQAPPGVLEQQQQVLAAWHTTSIREAQQQLGRLTSLRRLRLGVEVLGSPALRTALARHTQLSSLTLSAKDSGAGHMPAALAAAGSISRQLRSLKLYLHSEQVSPIGLSALAGVTRLVTATYGSCKRMGQYSAWAEEIGRMSGLRWLSVPDGLLVGGWGPLAGLQQLRVLVVHCRGSDDEAEANMGLLLEGWGRYGPPPMLQVLCVHGVSAEQAATGHCRLLCQVMRGIGGECVVGLDLSRVAHSAQQLAGLPVDLQQVLA